MSKTKNSISSNKEHDNLSSTSSSLSSDEEEIDARDLKPIKDYLSNRKELACQLFKSVKSEKIRMMLPQVLKQMDLSELEEWCVSELNGMSKARIMSILNGKAMLESSDTSESDDSGPSLEIISDTEEWTDDDTSEKENGKGKVKRDRTKVKGKAQVKKSNSDKSNIKTKCNKNDINDNNKDIKIKKEEDKEKGKEGDSLLELLELEMRARAIRALIRKEEDIIPSKNPSQTSNGETMENNMDTSQDDAKAKENCRMQLERIISAQQSNKGEDEDVVVVVQPTPVVELLSSDSDRENPDGAPMNKKLENARATESGKAANSCDENARNSGKAASSHESKERKESQETTVKHNDPNTVTKADLNTESEARMIMPERNVGIKNNTLSISISANNVAERRKRSRKRSQKQNAKVQITTATEVSLISKQINVVETAEQSGDEKNKDIQEQSVPNPNENEVTAKEGNRSSEEVARESKKVEEDRLADLDEIIDLDDYCDAMDIVSGDDEKSQDKIIVPAEQENKQPALQTSVSKVDSTETWASRYYQTDDVQHVIKESKIQSEIRKRLRERQRLSKLSKPSNLNVPLQSTAVDGASATPEKVPTGSVEEYLALKRAGTANVSSTTNDNTTPNNSDNNDTTQDNSATVNSNDVNVTESSQNEVQNENSSSVQECPGITSDVEKTAISEITVTQQSKVVTETKNDAQPV